MLEPCSNAWKALFAGAMKGKSVNRVFCTHMHPDHTGLAGWLCQKFDATLWMTRGEWLMARILVAEMTEEVVPEVHAERRFAGWSAEDIQNAGEPGYKRFAKVMFPMGRSYRRIIDGEVIAMGGRDWRVVVGSGHSPEHACLLNEKDGVLISGDQVLPKISSNVSINLTEPQANPLGEWLASITRFKELPDDLLVCPAHGEPFKGLHNRLKALEDEHHQRLETLHDFIAQPRRVVDSFGLLFNREINDEHRPLASGEALAHLRYLENAGRATCTVEDGVAFFTQA
jgi:glyoxylase-like metal-dependent hydrolase (beta-lactamase superfamily II)